MRAIATDRTAILGMVLAVAASLAAVPAVGGTVDCGGRPSLPDGTCDAAAGGDGSEATAGAEPAPSPAPPPESAPPSADQPQDSSPYLHRVAWWGFGTAAVGLTTWAITGGVSLAKTEALAEDCPDDVCPAERQDDLDSARTFAQIATAGFVVGVIGTVTGAIALLAAARDGEDSNDANGEATATVSPLIGPGYVGLGGRF